MKHWARYFLWYEAGLCLLLSVAFILWNERLSGADHVNHWLKDNRAVIYATLASVSGVLLGFSVTAVSILIGFVDSDRFKIIRDSGRVDDIWAVFFQAIWAFGGSTVLSFIGLIFDRDSDPNRWVMYGNVATLCFALARGLREIWVLNLAVQVLTPRRG